MIESNNTLDNEFKDILLSAVRQGDVNSLGNHLSTVSNPVIYLNQVYDEANEQKCTLLMIACLHGHENIVRMLLDHFSPNLEELNNVRLDEGYILQKMYIDVSVLWATVAINNFPIAKLLVEYGANVNHRTKTKSTPLRCSCHHGNIDMVRFLIENGADVYATNEKNETNLMVSASYNHLHMVTYLIDEFHCDVNACDNDGRSALYDAVSCKSYEIIEFLLKNGARNFRATCDQMSPLMWAAEKRCTNLVDTIAPYCSLVERIEADELLGSAFIYSQLTYIDLEHAFQYFYRALELRLTHNILKPLRPTTIEIFDRQQECQTLDELEQIRSSFENMYTEALLICERLLEPTNVKYLASLTYRGALLADEEQHHKALMFWMYELELRQQHSISFDSNQLREIVSLISEMLFKSISIPIDTLLTLLVAISKEVEQNKKEFSYNLYTLLSLITIIAQYLNKTIISKIDCQTVYHQLCKIIQCRFVTSNQGLSLLHLSLNNDTMIDDYHIKKICKYPCLQTTRILLQCGADVNATNAIQNTPLHVFVSNSESISDESILKLLFDAGAHADYVNTSGKTPFDLATDPLIKQRLKSEMHLSLKCLCARLIQKTNVSFHGKISTLLVSFVEKH